MHRLRKLGCGILPPSKGQSIENFYSLPILSFLLVPDHLSLFQIVRSFLDGLFHFPGWPFDLLRPPFSLFLRWKSVWGDSY